MSGFLPGGTSAGIFLCARSRAQMFPGEPVPDSRRTFSGEPSHFADCAEDFLEARRPGKPGCAYSLVADGDRRAALFLALIDHSAAAGLVLRVTQRSRTVSVLRAFERGIAAGITQLSDSGGTS